MNGQKKKRSNELIKSIKTIAASIIFNIFVFLFIKVLAFDAILKTNYSDIILKTLITRKEEEEEKKKRIKSGK